MQFDLLFDEPASRPDCQGITWPITVGVPCSDGALADVADLSVSAAGQAVPLQTADLLHWRTGYESVKWALLDFQTTYGSSNALPSYSVADTPATVSGPAIAINETGTEITVDTGACTFTVSKTAFSLLESYSDSSGALVSGSSLYWTDTNSNVYTSGLFTDSVVVERAGPLRAVIRAQGWYTTGGGDSKIGRYDVRITAFAGLPYVRIYSTFIWTANLNLTCSLVGTPSVPSPVSTWQAAPNLVAVPHGWVTGQPVTVYVTATGGLRDQAGTVPTVTSGAALTPSGVHGPDGQGTQTLYYIRALPNPVQFTLHRTANDAINGVNAMAFSTAGSGRITISATTPVVQEYGLSFNTANISTLGAAGNWNTAEVDTPTPIVVSGTVTALQDNWDTSTGLPVAKIGGSNLASGHRLAGWIGGKSNAAHGLGLAVLDLAYQTPKSLTVSASTVAAKLWSPDGTAGPMYLRETDVILPAEVGTYDKEWLSASGGGQDNEANAYGVAKTHEIWLWPHVSNANSQAVNDLIQHPPVVMADPAYQCRTDAVFALRAKSETPPAQGNIEDGIDSLRDFMLSHDPTYGDYQHWNFGDSRLFRSGAFRKWDSNGYSSATIDWRLFYRSGERKYLINGARMSKHVMDVDTCNYGPLTSGSSFGRRLGGSYLFAPCHWVWGPTSANYWQHPEYLMLHYCMTGYERAGDVLTLMADCMKNDNGVYKDPSYYAPYLTVTRNQYGIIDPAAIYFEWTADDYFMQVANSFTTIAENAQNAYPASLVDGGHAFPNINFQGYFWDGMERVQHLTNRQDVIPSLINAIADFSEQATSPYDAPYFGTTDNTMITRAFNQPSLFDYAYRHTGNLAYLQYGVTRLRRLAKMPQGTSSVGGIDRTNYTSSDALHMVGGLLGYLRIMAGWRDSKFYDFGDWLGNNVFFGSTDISSDTSYSYQSQLIVWVRKAAGVAGHMELVFKCSNLNPPELWVMPISSVNTSTDQITLSRPSNLVTGTPVIIGVTMGSAGTAPGGTALGTVYYARVISPTVIQLHTSVGGAQANTGKVDITGNFTGSIQLLGCDANGSALTMFGLMTAFITRPDGTQYAVPLNSNQAIGELSTISWLPNDPAGDYRIQIRSDAQIFACMVRSNLPGMVIELQPGPTVRNSTYIPLDTLYSTLNLRYQFILDAGYIIFKPMKGYGSLPLQQMGGGGTAGLPQLSRPLIVADVGDVAIAKWNYDDSTAMTVSLTGTQQHSLLALLKEECTAAPTQAGNSRDFNTPGVNITGILRYISTNRDQWYFPNIQPDFYLSARGNMFQDLLGTSPTVSNGQAVSNWKDRNGVAFSAIVPTSIGTGQITTATAPTYQTNVLNGKPGVLFDGVHNVLCAVSSSDWFPSGFGYLVFVMKTANTANSVKNTTPICTSDTSASNRYFWPALGQTLSPGQMIIALSSNVGPPSTQTTTFAGTQFVQNTAYVVEIVGKGLFYELYINGVLQGDGANNNGRWLGEVTPRKLWNMGGMNLAGSLFNAFNGWLFEAQYYSQPLDEDFRKGVALGLASYYGISLPGSAHPSTPPADSLGADSSIQPPDEGTDMQDKVTLAYTPACTLYARIYNPNGEVWNGSSFEDFALANIADYAVPYVEKSGQSGVYLLTFPTAILSGGQYTLHNYLQTGGAPTTADTPINDDAVEWDGTKLIGLDTFFARIKFSRAVTSDEYTVVLYYYGQQVLVDNLTDPVITIKNRDGTVRTATTPLVGIAGTAILGFSVTDPVQRIVPGADAVVSIAATLAGSVRNWSEIVGRDSVS